MASLLFLKVRDKMQDIVISYDHEILKFSTAWEKVYFSFLENSWATENQVCSQIMTKPLHRMLGLKNYEDYSILNYKSKVFYWVTALIFQLGSFSNRKSHKLGANAKSKAWWAWSWAPHCLWPCSAWVLLLVRPKPLWRSQRLLFLQQ